MARMSVLDMVQDILNDLDSDEVNSINDTAEALQIAQILETTFYEIIRSRSWPHLKTLVTLTASGSSAKPTHMSLEDEVQELLWFNYDKKKSGDTDPSFQPVTYITPEEFIDYINQRNSDNSNIDEITDYSGVTLLIRNDTAPTYYTSFDEENIVCDSYDSDVDTTLQSSKTQAYVYVEPTFSQTDVYVPDLPDKAFSYYLAEAKSVAFNALRQAPNPKEEQRSRRQRTRLGKEKWRINGKIETPDYGRK